MVRVYADVEVDLDDALGELSNIELTKLVEELLDEGHIPEGWEYVDFRSPARPLLSDGAVLLDVILELRKLGYTVEPGGK